MTTLEFSRTVSSDLVQNESLSQTRTAVETLHASGAIAMLADEPRPVLVGELHWVGENEMLLFFAHGDALADAHRVTFNDAIVNAHGSVTFLREQHVVAVLHAIDDADVDDPDDYRIAWELWQEVAPLRRGFIQRCFAAL